MTACQYSYLFFVVKYYCDNDISYNDYNVLVPSNINSLQKAGIGEYNGWAWDIDTRHGSRYYLKSLVILCLFGYINEGVKRLCL